MLPVQLLKYVCKNSDHLQEEQKSSKNNKTITYTTNVTN